MVPFQDVFNAINSFLMPIIDLISFFLFVSGLGSLFGLPTFCSEPAFCL